MENASGMILCAVKSFIVLQFVYVNVIYMLIMSLVLEINLITRNG